MTNIPTPPVSFLKLRRAANVLGAGGIVAYPTEAVYGLGCDPRDAEAVQKILDLKRRGGAAGLILIAADARQFAGWIDPSEAEAARLAGDDEGITWVVTSGPSTPHWITGGRETVAVRITRHPIAAALCRAADYPVVSTSANRHGCPPARNALAVRRAFGTAVDYVLPGPTGPRARPSEIRAARTGIVLRAG